MNELVEEVMLFIGIIFKYGGGNYGGGYGCGDRNLYG